MPRPEEEDKYRTLQSRPIERSLYRLLMELFNVKQSAALIEYRKFNVKVAQEDLNIAVERKYIPNGDNTLTIRLYDYPGKKSSGSEHEGEITHIEFVILNETGDKRLPCLWFQVHSEGGFAYDKKPLYASNLETVQKAQSIMTDIYQSVTKQIGHSEAKSS